jgi:hypothetical protein
MTPVTANRRATHRVDGRRRQGADRGVSRLPTLFDAAPGGPAVRVDTAPGGPAVRVDTAPGGPVVRVDTDHRPADQPVTAGSGETLDRLVVSSWERLASHADAACLVCGGTMEPRYGAHAAPIGGRCRDCGTTLG